MSRKCIFIMFFLLFVGAPSYVALGTDCAVDNPLNPRDPNRWWIKQTWNRSSTVDSNAWCDPTNWSPEGPFAGPPDTNSWAVICPTPPGPNITGNATAGRLSMYPWSWNYGGTANRTDVNVHGGLVDCGVVIDLAGKNGFGYAAPGLEQGPARLNVYSGTMITPAATSWGGEGDINGLWVGGSFTMINPYNTGICNIYGGLISVPRIAIYNGEIHLMGGVLEGLHAPWDVTPPRSDANDFWIGDDLTNSAFRNVLDISGGTLRLKGNWTSNIADYIATRHIVAYNDRGYVEYSFDGTKTTATGVPVFGPAWYPRPYDGQVEVNFTPVLVWSPGDWVNDVCDSDPPGLYNKGHHVYMGTDYAEVLSATSIAHPGVVFSVNDVNFYKPVVELLFNTPYYWRVDEVNDPCVGSPWTGKVWQFMTFSGIATNPYPDVNSTTGFDINRLYLSWTPGLFVDETDTDNNGHDVYFGTSLNDVSTATTSSSLVYRGRQTQTKYYLDSLSGITLTDANYYWRIDELNNTHPLKKWKGAVWKFVFPNSYIVDNFDSYGTTADMSRVWHTDYAISPSSLYCGTGATTTGATINLNTGLYAMQYDYNNTGLFEGDPDARMRYSEARLEYNTTGVDWTASSVPADTPVLLIVSYIGAADNNVDPTYDRMYVAIRDAANHLGLAINNPDASAQRKDAWQDWMIKLSVLSGGTVDLTHDVNLLIGFGQRCNKKGTGTPGGMGRVNFDNIRLSLPVCNPPYGPSADFDGDCFVSNADLDMFVNDWLLQTETNTPPISPVITDPCLWYKFDETTGRKAINSGGGGAGNNVYDANVESNSLSTWDSNSKIGTGCVKLPYGSNSYVNVPPEILAGYDAGTKTAFTITCWLIVDTNYAFDNWMGLVSVYTDTEIVEIECPTPWPPPPQSAGGPKARFKGPQMDISPTSTQRMGDFSVRWNHYAFVVDAVAGMAKIYENGYEIASVTKAFTLPLFPSAPTRFHIGTRSGDNWGCWWGRLDDFRFYDYALTANQVAYIATESTGTIIVPLVERTNFVKGSPLEDPQVVNFRDFSTFAGLWMTEQLWPLD